jgi:enoyl-CoA hydratase
MDSNLTHYRFLEIEQRGPVALLTIHRPPVNALSTELLLELQRAAAGFAAAPQTRVVVLTGDGKAFVAGADIVEMQAMDSARAREYGALGQSVFSDIETLPQPVIAAVNGYALGGGCELAMACDIRIASEAAVFGQPEVNLAVIPGFGGTQRLPRLVGYGKAKELIFTGEHVRAAEAHRLGLANRVVASDALLPEALQLAALIASRGPVAVRSAKRAINLSGTDGRAGFAMEAELLGHCFATADRQEGMRAFLEKRTPAFMGE